MARVGLLASLAAAFVAAVIVLQLIVGVDDPLTPLRAHSNAFTNTGRSPEDQFLLGAGKADITGPVVELNFMGYASLGQVGTGLRQRIHSRAFIVANPDNTDDCFVYVVLDTQSGDTAIRNGILAGLAALGGDYARYGQRNVAISGTHSHSGPGAWLNYLLPQITSLGFNKQSYQAIVDGTVLSIQRAHESLVLGHLSFGSTDVQNSNINRSPYAYLANPEEERSRYTADVDKTMTLLKFDRISDQKTIGILTFFPVHGTSMLENNTLVTGDNKGVAATLFERSVQGDDGFADGFVAGFSQANVGDTTPNVLGAWCEDGSGEQCKFEDSTCGGKTEDCHGRGPFFREKDEGAKSCFEIGRLQYSAAKTLVSQMSQSATTITGHSVSAFHSYHDFSNFTFNSPFNGSQLQTCSAALGFSFAGGTSDGPGAFDFTQNGSGSPALDNPLWYVVRDFLHDPTPEQEACQSPKTILLDVGSVDEPYAWAPNIVDIQTLRVGQLFIIVSPGEATTMSGRRWKDAVAKAATDSLSVADPLVVLGAPANSYTHYIATEEEYGIQRYEGASTLYGPSTLAAYINLTITYLPSLGDSTAATIPAGPNPPINTDNSLSFITPVVYDGAPLGKSFGNVLSSPSTDKSYGPGETVQTVFVGANPRNNLRLESTFAAIEQQVSGTNTWKVVRDDTDWTLVYQWNRTNSILGTSTVALEWYIDDDYYGIDNPNRLESGTYRMHYYGDAKTVTGAINAFEGIGGTFNVTITS